MESTNATTFYTRLIMLMSAAEGLAGERPRSRGGMETNKDVLEKILGKRLYKKVFTFGSGLRHKLAHGAIKDHYAYIGLSDKIYKRILKYLEITYKIKFQKIASPQRNFYENYQYSRGYRQFKDKPLFDLAKIEKVFDAVDEDNIFIDERIEEPKKY